MSVRSETIKFKNPTTHTLKLEAAGLEDVPPGGEIEVPIELAAPGLADNGKRAKSAIECVAPQLVPVHEADKKAWERTPAPPEPKSKIVSIAARAKDEAPGVRALRQQREALIKAEQEKQAAKAAAEGKTAGA